MDRQNWRLGLLALLIGVGALGITSAARAQQCSTNAECGAGFACHVSKEVICSGGGCAGGAGGSFGAAGTIGSAGSAGVGGGCVAEPLVCNAVDYGYCDVVPCSGDADCLPGTVCLEQNIMQCSLVDPCPQLTSCPVDPATVETICQTAAQRSCVARNSLACAADVDCGDGFRCMPGGEICTCTGVGGAGGGTAGVAGGQANVGGQGGSSGAGGRQGSAGSQGAGAGVAGGQGNVGGRGGGGESCSCTPTMHCEPEVLPCSTTNDCPSAFDCAPNPCGGCGGTAGAGGGGTGGSVGGAGVGGAVGGGGTAGGGGPAICIPDPSLPPLVCQPALYLNAYLSCSTGSAGAGGPGVGGGGGSFGGASGAGGGTSSGAAGRGSAGSNGGAAGSIGSPGTGDGGDHHGRHRWPLRRFGCSTTNASSADAWSALALVGLALLAVRRRQHYTA